jgi:hypothetical protein
MCRNIRVLHNFEPPTTRDEMRAAALQYVRKVSGLSKPAHADEAVFQLAVDAVSAATEQLLRSLQARGRIRTREGEQERARARWKDREARMTAAITAPAAATATPARAAKTAAATRAARPGPRR